MFFVVSKLLTWLAQPYTWIALLLLADLPRRGQPARRWPLPLALALLLLSGWEWPADALLGSLEDQVSPYARQDPDGNGIDAYAGVIVLGGALQPGRMWTRPGQLPLEPSAERMIAAARLAREHPRLTVVFTGGEGELLSSGLTESARAHEVFAALGLEPGRVRYEPAARNTVENARYCARLPDLDPRRPWLLLSSAYHLPRALATFRRAGWNVSPYPVDYRTPGHTPWWRFDWLDAAVHWQLALHEWLGLLVYRLVGWA